MAVENYWNMCATGGIIHTLILVFLPLVSWCIMKTGRDGSRARVCLVEYDDFLDVVKNHLADDEACL